jgi:predicted transcriptional regulator
VRSSLKSGLEIKPARSGKAKHSWFMPNEISIHLIKIHQLFARKRKQWLTSADIAQLIPDVARRTINHHAKRLTEMGVLEKSEVFGGYRYRYLAAPNSNIVEQLEDAANAFGR